MEDIVLITNDSWRRDTLERMANLNHVAESFNTLDAVCQGASTKSALPPIISSSYWKENEGTRAKEPTSLPAFLADNGYSTGAFIGTNPFASQWKDDFDAFWNGGSGNYNKYTRKVSRGIDLALLRKETPAKEVYKHAKKWYNSCSGPRFMWIHLMDSHEPYYPGLQRGMSNGLIKTYKSLLENRTKFDEGKFFTDSFSPDVVDQLERLYRECVQNVDDVLPLFLELVDDRATVILTGDHGEEFDHGYMKHQRLYDECVVVPCLVRWTLDGTFDFNKEIFHIDIAPTLARGLGLQVPDEWQGRSEPQEVDRISLMFNADHRINRWFIGARTQKYKYIETFDHSTGEQLNSELYDLERDPIEDNNIFTSDHPYIEAAQQRINEYFEETGHSRSSLIEGQQPSDLNEGASEELEEQLAHLGYR